MSNSYPLGNSPQIQRMMEHIALCFEGDKSTRQIQDEMIARFGWSPSKKQVTAICQQLVCQPLALTTP